MNRVVHFEIYAADPERAAAFYRNVFGWKIEEWVVPGVRIPDENRYWLVTTGPDEEAGINGGLLFRRGPEPQERQAINAFVCTIEVDELDGYLEKAQKAGAQVDVPKMPVKGIGWIAYCKDTEGNLFGMIQNDPNAA